MFRRFSINFALFSIFFDGACVAGSLGAATVLRLALNSLSHIKFLPFVNLPLELYIVFPAVWVGVFLLLSVYDGRRNLRVIDELNSVIMASLISIVSLAGVLYLSYREVSRALFGVFVLTSFLSLVAWRLVVRVFFRWKAASGYQTRKVVIAGAGEMGGQIRAQLESKPYLGLEFLGFLDDDAKKRAAQPEIIGSVDEVRKIVLQRTVDDIVIALPRSAYKQLNRLVATLHDLPVKVWIVPDYFSLALHRASIEDMAGIPMLDLRAPALSEYQRLTKRAFDLGLSLLALLLALPAMGAIALAIRLDTPGPIFYRQKRVGENGRLFEMIKFRSMVQNADKLRDAVEKRGENGRVVQLKSRQDPRITRVGRFLRRTSLDELPQLINVLRGEMSLIGPRPELPYLVEKYELWQRKRFAVPQGMTGWWQINGRSDKPMYLHTEEDLYYVQHYSLWLDFQILFKTIWVVLRGKGAY
jgi:exopolysaccharide biosynthesis polyprenyl glycosylphosphotransferase